MKRTVTYILALAICFLTVFVSAQEKPGDNNGGKKGFAEITSSAERSIEKGLAWLVKSQNRSGAFGNNVQVATTSMACLSLLAAGNTPTRGKYAENVKRGLSFILSCASRSGYINEGGGRGMGGSGMHGHGFATLFLAEVYGMTQETDADRETIKDVLRRAVSLIEKSQSPQGGWYYEPVSGGDEGSVTIAQVSALRSARNAGIKVNAKTIEKAVDYIKHCTHQDGLVQYSYSGGGTSAALTAAGMSVLTYLGLYQDERIEKGLDYLLDVAPFIKGDKKGGVRPGDYGWSSYYFYTSLYGSIAMFQKGGKYWERWYPSMRDELVKIQAADGSWTQYEGSSYGAAFGTGFALLILEIPYRYLPIFQN